MIFEHPKHEWRTGFLVGENFMFPSEMMNSPSISEKDVIMRFSGYNYNISISGWCWLEPWNFEWLSIQLGMENHPQLTFTQSFFQRGWLNHQPDFVASKTWVVNNHENPWMKNHEEQVLNQWIFDMSLSKKWCMPKKNTFWKSFSKCV